MIVKLINAVNAKRAKKILVFTKQTRLLSDEGRWDEVYRMTAEELNAEIPQIFSTIRGPLEFVDYILYIGDVTRAFTHQLVRHRVGVSFAQQSMRFTELDDWNYLTTGSILKDHKLTEKYKAGMSVIGEVYRQLIEDGADQQDARGILPTNVLTNILMKINLRALSDMMAIRLCIRSQGEFREVAQEIKRVVVDTHPFVEELLNPACIQHGACPFRNFKKCPYKKRFHWLDGPNIGLKGVMKEEWEKISKDFSPQPKSDSWEEKK